MNKLFYYIPCYNEQGNIGELLKLWLKEEEQLREEGYELVLLPIDDKSTDNTLVILHDMEKQHPQIHVIAHKVNQNLGGGLMTAIEDFRKHGHKGDLMGMMDGDNTHKPEFVHRMIAKIKTGADCVIASRYQPGAKIHGVPNNRLFLSDGARVYYSMVLRVPNVKDYTCGYRLYTYDAIQKGYDKYGKQLVTMKSFSCMMELLYKLYRSGCRFAEVPFTLYYDNKVGSSKMRVVKTLRDSLLVALHLRLSK